MSALIFISQEVVDGLLTYSRMVHPKEGILLLRGEERKGDLYIEEIVIPPLATHGIGFSSFPLHHLPIDFSIVGVAHSHPSGSLRPSVTDLNHFYGSIMVIVAYPYTSERDIGVFDSKGKMLDFKVVRESSNL
ncbi:MAG TPA: peptidase [Candidatus Bathyarchaeota archaeon]|nr:peptidase [Candidatus Bathyarchaeota archaeon]